MYNRLKKLRNKLKLSQKKFAESLGIGQSTLGMMEVGKREIGERHIKTICAIYDVNEEWLRTGNGEIFNEINEDNELSTWLNNILKDRPDNFKRRFLTVLSTLKENEWSFLEEKAEELIALKKDIKPSSENISDKISVVDEISVTDEESKESKVKSKDIDLDFENIDSSELLVLISKTNKELEKRELQVSKESNDYRKMA